MKATQPASPYACRPNAAVPLGTWNFGVFWTLEFGVWSFGCLLLFVCLCSPSTALASPKQKVSAAVDYNRDIRPIFSDNCYACHGPDQNKRKAGLRLAQKDGELRELKSRTYA